MYYYNYWYQENNEFDENGEFGKIGDLAKFRRKDLDLREQRKRGVSGKQRI